MNYEDLREIPKLEGVTFIGDKKVSDYGLVPHSPEEITEIQLEIFGYVL